MSKTLERVREYANKNSLSERDAARQLGIPRATIDTALRRERLKKKPKVKVIDLGSKPEKRTGLLSRIEDLEKQINKIWEILR
jgi:IS30 family transposase